MFRHEKAVETIACSQIFCTGQAGTSPLRLESLEFWSITTIWANLIGVAESLLGPQIPKKSTERYNPTDHKLNFCFWSCSDVPGGITI